MQTIDHNYLPDFFDDPGKLNEHIASLKKRFPEFKDKSREEMLTILRDNENRIDYETTWPYRPSLEGLTRFSQQETDQKKLDNYIEKKNKRTNMMKERKPATGLTVERTMKEKLEHSWANSFEQLAVAMDFTQQALDNRITPSHIEKLIDSKMEQISHIYTKHVPMEMMVQINELLFSGKAVLRDLMEGKLDGQYGPDKINILGTRKYTLHPDIATTKVNDLLDSNYVDKKMLGLTDEKLVSSLTSGMMKHYGVSKDFIEDGLILHIDPSGKFDYMKTFLEIIRRIAENELDHNKTIPIENKDWIKKSLYAISEEGVNIDQKTTEGTEKLVAYSVILDVLRTRLDESGVAIRDWGNIDNLIPQANSSTKLWHQEILDAQENSMKLLQNHFSKVRPWIGIDYTETDKRNHVSYHGKDGKIDVTSHLTFSIPSTGERKKPLVMLIYFDPDRKDYFLNKEGVSCPEGVNYKVNINSIEDNNLRNIPLSEITQAQIQQYADCFTLPEKK